MLRRGREQDHLLSRGGDGPECGTGWWGNAHHPGHVDQGRRGSGAQVGWFSAHAMALESPRTL